MASSTAAMDIPTPGRELKMRGVPLSDSRGRSRVYLAAMVRDHEGPDAAVDSVIMGSHGNSSSPFYARHDREVFWWSELNRDGRGMAE